MLSQVNLFDFIYCAFYMKNNRKNEIHIRRLPYWLYYFHWGIEKTQFQKVTSNRAFWKITPYLLLIALYINQFTKMKQFSKNVIPCMAVIEGLNNREQIVRKEYYYHLKFMIFEPERLISGSIMKFVFGSCRRIIGQSPNKYK